MIFTKQVKEAVSFHFIQSCYSLSSGQQSSFQRTVMARAKKLFPEYFTSPEAVKAPAGFIHAYDLGRLAIAALQQITLTDDIKQNQYLFTQALESLQQPVQGLIKEYDKPFFKWSDQKQDAHEALMFENFCMASFGVHNEIKIMDN
jgi:branched-chain amino acid transport system substrate-binding protein